MPITRRSLLLIAVLPLLPGKANERRGLQIAEPWSRSTPPTARTGVVYLTIRNEGADPDMVTSVESNAAGRVEIHRTAVESGVARMLPVPQLEIPPRTEIRLEPNGLHLMLVDLRAPLVAGSTISVTIRFRSGEAATFEVPIRSTRPSGHSAH